MVRMTIRSGARVTRPTSVAVSTTRGGGEKGGAVVVRVGAMSACYATLCHQLSGVQVSDHLSALKSICDFWFICICNLTYCISIT